MQARTAASHDVCRSYGDDFGRVYEEVGIQIAELLNRIGDLFRSAVRCEDVFTYEWIRHRRRVCFADVYALGDPTFCAATRRLEGCSAIDYLSATDRPDGETWPGELWGLNRVTSVDRAAIVGRGAEQMHWGPAGITSTVGFDVAEGGEVLGGVCAVRRETMPPFSRKSREAAWQVEETIADLFVDVCRLRAVLSQRSGARSVLIFDPDGTLSGHKPGSAPWTLMEPTTTRLSALARRLGDESLAEQSWFVRRAPVRFARLVGDRPLIMATAVEGARYRPGSREMLTPMQRHVADCIVAGATIDEAARSLGRSATTVHHHLKQTYRRLGIGSRAELTAALEPSPVVLGDSRVPASVAHDRDGARESVRFVVEARPPPRNWEYPCYEVPASVFCVRSPSSRDGCHRARNSESERHE